MERISQGIYLGDMTDAVDKQHLFRNGITATLNVASIGHHYTHDGILVSHIPLVDGPGNELWELEGAILALQQLRQEGHTVLVHCLAGVSRSPTVIACYMAISLGCTFEEAINFIQKVRSIVDPHKALIELAHKFLGR